MRDVLKQRLVGALVIIALGVIFWPLIFVDVERPQMERESQVPPMPRRQQEPVSAPTPLKSIKSAPEIDIALHDAPPTAVDHEAQKPEAKPVAKPAPKPALDKSGIPIAWVLQVITVGKREKAETLTAQLIEQGYKAYHRPLKREGRTLHRVYIGPVFEKARLNDAQRSVEKQFGVDAIISRYLP